MKQISKDSIVAVGTEAYQCHIKHIKHKIEG